MAIEYGPTTALKPVSRTTFSHPALQLLTSGINLFIAVVTAFAVRFFAVIAAPFGNRGQFVTQFAAFLGTLSLVFRSHRRSLHLLLAACVIETIGAFFALTGQLVTLNHLRLDLDPLGPSCRWTLAEMHLAIGIGPAVDFRSRQPRQYQQAQQNAHGFPP